MAPSANFVDLCRICATETQSIVRHFIFEGEGKLRDLSKKIAACLPVKVKEDDRLPKVLCGECVYKLDLLHEFREKSQKTEAYLFTLIDGPASDHHVRKQSSSQLRGAEEEDDDDSHGGGDNDGGHDIDDDDDELEPVTPAPVRRNAQGQICEPEVVIKVEEDNSKGDAAAASATSATPSAAAGAEDGGSPSKRPRRAAANKRPIREDSPSLEAPSSPPPPKRRGRKPKGVTPTSSAAAATSTATPGTSTSGDESSCVEDVEDAECAPSPHEMVINIEPHFLLQGTTYGTGSSTTSSAAEVGVANVDTATSASTSNRKNENPEAPGYASDSSLEAEALGHLETEQKLRQRLEQGSKQRSKEPRAEEWERNMSKKLRLEGKPYIGRIKHKDGTSSAIIRPGKIMGPPCNSVVCNGANCKRRCAYFSHEERKSIHRKFWKELNWEQRKMYVYAHVKVIKREDGNVTSKKQNTFTYCLTNSSNEKLIVCKTMFSNTLSLGHRQISNWTKSGSFGIPSAKPPKKVRVREKTEFPGYSDAKEYLENLPKQPSRGKDAGRILENVYQKKELYQSYVKYCELRGKTPTSHTTLCRVFGDMKLQLAKPRKDQQPARPGPSGQHRKESRAANVARLPGPTEGLLALSSPPAATLPAAAPVHPSPFFPQSNQQAQYNPLNPYNQYYTTYNDASRQEQNDQQQNRGFYSS